MTKTYKIEGITCDHCIAKIEKTLQNLENVATAQIQKEAPQAKLKLNGLLSVANLQDTLAAAGNYKIEEYHN